MSLVSDGPADGPARHGWEEARKVLRSRGIAFEEVTNGAEARGTLLLVGTQVGSSAFVEASARRDGAVSLPWTGSGPATRGAESVAVRHGVWHGKETEVVLGGDSVGLMYGLLDAADRIGWAANPARPFSEFHDVTESPEVKERGVCVYTMHRGQFEDRLFDADYWERYFDMLARDRFNSFTLIFGYETSGYFAPVYPWFFDVDGFPDVRVVGQSREKQERNREALRRLIRQAHEHGLKFTAGLWDHIYRGGVQGPKELAERPTPGLAWGLTGTNLLAYTRPALEKFLATFPIDGIQFRMHDESGLRPEEYKDFWEMLYGVMKRHPAVLTDCRLKGFTDDAIEHARELGLNFRVDTKFWAEHMGLPYHPTRVQEWNQYDRRHSYADVLRYPKKYRIAWQLWTGGTARTLLWGDPEYVRRFDAATHLYDGDGFQIAEPLATKMASHHDVERPFDLLNGRYRYFDYEFERYWHFFQVFGRLGYNPATPSEIWEREFARRMGQGTGPIAAKALHRASGILPRIEAYCMPQDDFAMTRGWTEKQRMKDLAEYATNVTPSDPQQFESMAEAGRRILNGEDGVKISPVANARWFARASADVLGLVEQVEATERRDGASGPGSELYSTLVDLRILGHLAGYHAYRSLAGLAFALFNESGDVSELDEAIIEEERAVGRWEKLVAAAGDVYAEDLMMGRPWVGMSGHWRDELAALRLDLAGLKARRDGWRPPAPTVMARVDFGSGPAKAGFEKLRKQAAVNLPLPNGSYRLEFTVPGGANGIGPMWIEANGIDYSPRFTVSPGESVEKEMDATVNQGRLNVLFRPTTSARWDVGTMTVARRGPGIAVVPARNVRPGQSLRVQATIAGDDPLASAELVYGDGRRGMRRTAMRAPLAPVYSADIPAAFVEPGLDYWIEAADARGARVCSRRIEPIVSNDDEPPVIAHAPVLHAAAGKPLTISVRVQDPSGVKSVRLRYRSMTQFQDYRTLEMLPEGRGEIYQATIPSDQIPSEWDLMYFIEAVDRAGNGTIYPDLEKETPYIVVSLER